MSKKLKKKIEEICGLADLDWEARQTKANQILSSSEWKQQLCNELQGLSFRELESYLSGVASERQKREDSFKKKIKKSSEKKVDNDRPKETYKPRTLAEILAQVYAPRVSNVDLSDRSEIIAFRERFKRSNDLLSDSDDGDNKS